MPDLLTHLLPYALATIRVGAAMVLAPIIGGAVIPAQARVLFAFAMAAAIYPTLGPPPAAAGTAPGGNVFTLGIDATIEMLIGLCLGLLMMMPVVAVQLSGLLMGQQMGFGLAQVYNPAIDADTDILGDLLGYIALGVFVTIGGLEGTFLAVARSFQAVPVGVTGHAAPAPPLELMTNLLGSGFELATRVSLPLMGIIMIETVAMALLSKSLPQANIMSIGFAVKILLGFAAIVAGLSAGHTAIADHVSESTRLILQWASAPAMSAGAGR